MSDQWFFHLRGYRKRANLTQKELGYLLGFATEANVHRYETRQRAITLDTALMLQAVFQTPVNELLADQYAQVELAVTNRARTMHAAINCGPCQHCRDCQRREFLENLINRVPARAPASIWNKKRTMPPSLP